MNRWLTRVRISTEIAGGDGQASLRYRPPPDSGFTGRVLTVTVSSLADGTWSRLKACPDCRWVFYDHTRSHTKTWCGMVAGTGGRACGTIAKVKRHRQRSATH